MSASLADALRRFAASIVATLETRLALVGADVEVQAAWLSRLAAQAAIAFALALMSCVALAAFVVIAFWEHRVAVAGVVALAFLVATLGTLARLAVSLRERPALFAATLQTLAEDRERLDHEAAG